MISGTGLKSPLILLVHSPLVGPSSWARTGQHLRQSGWTVAIPSLQMSQESDDSFWHRQVEAVAAQVDPATEGVVLIGHSGAGALLPAIGQRLDHSVGYIFVDAGLPTPGLSWLQTAPVDLVEMLRAQLDEGYLPPWNEWFGADALADLVPDEQLRAALVEQMQPVPWAMLDEPRPVIEPWPDAGVAYLQLSDGYSEEAAEARAIGWPVRQLAGDNHLATVTKPAAVAQEIAALAMLLLT